MQHFVVYFIFIFILLVFSVKLHEQINWDKAIDSKFGVWFVLASAQSAKACSANARFYALEIERATELVAVAVLLPLAAVFAHWRLQHCSFFICGACTCAGLCVCVCLDKCCAHAKFMSLMCKQTETKKTREHTYTQRDSRRLNASKFKLVCVCTNNLCKENDKSVRLRGHLNIIHIFNIFVFHLNIIHIF